MIDQTKLLLTVLWFEPADREVLVRNRAYSNCQHHFTVIELIIICIIQTNSGPKTTDKKKSATYFEMISVTGL